jgi:hypothetical protein
MQAAVTCLFILTVAHADVHLLRKLRVLQINENKAIGKTKKYAPYATGKAAKCKVCKSTLHQEGIYCHGCAYKKGKHSTAPAVSSRRSIQSVPWLPTHAVPAGASDEPASC